MPSIKAIEGRSVHQIQSGQVIVDLCSVVKELVENSLDAGATSIDVRFKDNGLESIEVQDNGGGIASDDYTTIALKHCTSKLASYTDLTTLDTFGFRGEALSSLCALSKFHIVTARADEAPKGKRLDFEVSGKLKGTTVAASPKGTTVAVEELFYNLPVRRRELERNIKREYRKVLEILHAYACVSTGVRLSVTHQPHKGKKATVFSTKGSSNTRDNVANIYGSKTLSALIALNLKLALQPTASQTVAEAAIRDDSASKEVSIVGHVSRPVFGEGRSTPDRQMFFVNGRPCLLPQIAKAFNEAYRSYNVTQSPFVLANLVMDANAYDVNVSPDKRTILLHDQMALIEALKQCLVDLFDAQEQTVPQSQLQTAKLPAFRQLNINREDSNEASNEAGNASPVLAAPFKTVLSRTQDDTAASSALSSNVDSSDVPSMTSQASDAPGLLSRFVGRNLQCRDQVQPRSGRGSKEKLQLAGRHLWRTGQIDGEEEQEIETDSEEGAAGGEDEQPKLDAEVTRLSDGPSASFSRVPAKRDQFVSSGNTAVGNKLSSPTPTWRPPASKRQKLAGSASNNPPHAGSQSTQFAQRMYAFAAPGSQLLHEGTQSPGDASDDEMGVDREKQAGPATHSSSPGTLPSRDDIEDRDVLQEDDVDGEGSDVEDITEEERRRRDEARAEELVRLAEAKAPHPTLELQKRTTSLSRSSTKGKTTLGLVQTLETYSQSIEEQLTRLSQAHKSYQSRKGEMSAHDQVLSSKATAEERLSLTIAKTDFARMKIIGQFNLGFVLAVRPAKSTDDGSKASDELFIIDQHASDEIYNFSRLSLTTTLTPQPLVRRHTLELTAVEEETIASHTDTLAKNGFNIVLDESGDSPVGQRCQLLTLPTSRETVFDTRDLEELISLLSEATPAAGEIIRPSKVRKMLAMRACRSSIMIGKTLTQKTMQTVVRHMGEIDKPWNCPHGRPTMRHLASLGQWGGWVEGDVLADEEEGESRPVAWSGYLSEQARVKGPDSSSPRYENRGEGDGDGVDLGDGDQDDAVEDAGDGEHEDAASSTADEDEPENVEDNDGEDNENEDHEDRYDPYEISIW